MSNSNQYNPYGRAGGGNGYYNPSNQAQEYQSSDYADYTGTTFNNSSPNDSPQLYDAGMYNQNPYGGGHGHGHGHGPQGLQNGHGRVNSGASRRGPMSGYQLWQHQHEQNMRQQHAAQQMQQQYAQDHTPLQHGNNMHFTGHHLNNGYGSGGMSNSTPSYSPADMHRHGAQQEQQQGGGAQAYTQHNEHWEVQLRLYEVCQQRHHTATVLQYPNQVARLPQKTVRFVDKSTEKSADDSFASERPSNKATEVQEWKGLSLDGHGYISLSSAIFSYKHLHELFIGSNKLLAIPPTIGTLRNLRVLDLSTNNVSELPAELGMCTHLEKLYFFDNNIRTLPRELGSLSELQMLGVQGNPLDPTLKQMIIDSGTKALILHLRENGPIPEPPARRPMIIISDSDTSASSSTSRIKILTYNILCDYYATEKQFGYTPSGALSWDYRRETIWEEIETAGADILCLQEIDTESFEDFFCVKAAHLGLKGVFFPKGRAQRLPVEAARTVDGCAIFYKKNKYILLDKQLVEFANLAINRGDVKDSPDFFNRVGSNDHIAMICFFENRSDGSRFVVANAHTIANPEYIDVKTVQTIVFLEKLEKEATRYARWPATPLKDKRTFNLSSGTPTSTPGTTPGIDGVDDPLAYDHAPSQTYVSMAALPLFVVGDFNSPPGSAVHTLLSTGSVAGDHKDFGDYSYGNLTKLGFQHPFQLKSAYEVLDGTENELPWTNYTPGFTGILDYIWYSGNTLDVEALLGPTDKEYLTRVPGFPHWHFPSDHISLLAEFNFKKNGSRLGGVRGGGRRQVDDAA